jgi:hypothetical protein
MYQSYVTIVWHTIKDNNKVIPRVCHVYIIILPPEVRDELLMTVDLGGRFCTTNSHSTRWELGKNSLVEVKSLE